MNVIPFPAARAPTVPNKPVGGRLRVSINLTVILIALFCIGAWSAFFVLLVVLFG